VNGYNKLYINIGESQKFIKMAIDRVLYFCYTFNMKTAISLPDRIYLEAEKTARNLGISRSTLYLNALTEYLKKNNRENITQRLNEVYNDDYYAEFEPISNASLESMRELTKNDTW
jgi:hypothetical protein